MVLETPVSDNPRIAQWDTGCEFGHFTLRFADLSM